MNMHRIYAPFLRHFRRSRIDFLYRVLDIGPETRVVDVGGNTMFWEMAHRWGHAVPRVTVLNLLGPDYGPPGYRHSSLLPHLRQKISWVIGSATRIPLANRSFDVAFSNSLLEHLTPWRSQQQCATEIRRVAWTYFVQTPNRKFFVEPHLLTPFVHWLSPATQRRVIRNFTVWGVVTRPSAEQCAKFVSETKLLDRDEMRLLFPDANCLAEAFMFMPKSLLAVKTNA